MSRIEELAKQAGLCDQPFDIGEESPDGLEKFAELVLMESCKMMQGFTFEKMATSAIMNTFGEK